MEPPNEVRDSAARPARDVPGGLRRLAAVIGFIWLTTARHEASHAVMAWLEGGEVRRLRLVPGFEEGIGFYFGLVERSEGTWLVTAAPFAVAALSIALCLVWASRLTPGGRGRLAVVVFGVLSPVADLAYGYQGGFWRQVTDVAKLLAVLPPVAVHVFFLVAIATGLGGAAALRRAGRLTHDRAAREEK